MIFSTTFYFSSCVPVSDEVVVIINYSRYSYVMFSCPQYADPVADLLDRWGVFRARLFRESCVFHHGNYVKDLNKLGRDLHQVIIVDNSPASYIFHPDNAVSRSSLNKTHTQQLNFSLSLSARNWVFVVPGFYIFLHSIM